MRIVDRKTFLALPAGTVFAKMALPQVYDIGALCIKGEERGPNDFWVLDPGHWWTGCGDSGDWFDGIDAMVAGSEFEIDIETVVADGLFDAEQLFLVLSREDVRALIGRFEQALTEGYAADPVAAPHVSQSGNDAQAADNQP